jgi:hypothetical protein
MKSQGRPVVYHSLSYEELGEYVGAKGVVPVKKSWLEALGFIVGERPNQPQESVRKEPLPQIKYELTKFDT